MTRTMGRNYFQIWRTDSRDSRDENRLESLAGLLGSANLWIVQNDGAVTHNFRTGLTLHGLPATTIRGFLVTRGDVGRAMSLASSIDWAMLRGPAVSAGMEERMKALSMISFFPVAWTDATLMAFWTAGDSCGGSSTVSADITLGSVNALTNWLKRIRSVGCHIDSGAFNVNGEAQSGLHTNGGHNRRQKGALACIGSCEQSPLSVEQALVASGLGRDRFEIEVSVDG